MKNQQLVFRFAHDGIEHNIATSSFTFVESGTYKTAFGDIPDDKPLSLKKSMGTFLWTEGQSDYQFSDLWLLNQVRQNNDGKGKYDDLVNVERDTAVELFVCEIDADGYSDYADWTKVGELHIDRARNRGDNLISIKLNSKLVKMEKNTENQYYSDTLVYSNNRSQSRPICIGICENVPGKLVDDTTNEYEFHDEDVIQNLFSAYDDFDAFSYPADYSKGSIASTGGYGINLGSPAVGKVTARINAAKYSGLLTNIFSKFILKILVDYASIPLLDIDESSLNSVHSEWLNWYGIYIDQPTNVRQIVEEANISHCGYSYINQSGQIAFGWLKEPSGTPDYEISEYYISSKGVDVDTDGAPGLSDAIASERNWHVFTDGDVALSVSQSDKDKVTQKYQSYYRSPTTTSGSDAFDDFYAHARNGCHIGTLGADATRSQSLITHLENLFAVERKLCSFEIVVSDLLIAMQMNIGEEIRITWPRHGLDSGKDLIIKDIDYSNLMKRKIKIIGWG